MNRNDLGHSFLHWFFHKGYHIIYHYSSLIFVIYVHTAGSFSSNLSWIPLFKQKLKNHFEIIWQRKCIHILTYDLSRARSIKLFFSRWITEWGCYHTAKTICSWQCVISFSTNQFPYPLIHCNNYYVYPMLMNWPKKWVSTNHCGFPSSILN